MGIQNCRRCGRLFLSSGLTICQDCIGKEEDLFEVVKEYLSSHSGASVRVVSEDTGVPVEIVTEFVRQGRIVGTEFNDEAGSSVLYARGRLQQAKYALSAKRPFPDYPLVSQAKVTGLITNCPK